MGLWGDRYEGDRISSVSVEGAIASDGVRAIEKHSQRLIAGDGVRAITFLCNLVDRGDLV